jgi:hypothetical protein
LERGCSQFLHVFDSLRFMDAMCQAAPE